MPAVIRISMLENAKGIWISVWRGKIAILETRADNLYAALEIIQEQSEKYFPDHS